MNSARLPSNATPCRPAHLVYLAEYMRPDEQRQFTAATGFVFEPNVAAQWLVNTAARSGAFAVTILRSDGLPAAAGGFEPVAPGVWQSWMVGSQEGWAEQWRSLTKATLWLMERIFSGGAHRLQTCATTEREKAIEWFERSLGFKLEGVFRHYGPAGEDIAHFARLRGE